MEQDKTTRWGVVATIKAPVLDILAFAAHHLDLGAHRLYIYLDQANPDAFTALKAHPKIRVTTCDDTYWRKSGAKRPRKHQVRQTHNATHAYARKPEVDWLIHIDVDEFLWPDHSVAQSLSQLSDADFCARVRPIEALAGDGTAFKGFIPSGPDRDRIVARLYPTFGQYLKGGFISHVAGKLFVRTGYQGLTVRIHNVFTADQMNPGLAELTDIQMCHCHATSWESWMASYQYRLAQGSYRSGLPPARSQNGINLHTLFATLEDHDGEAGLRAFYDEVCSDTPALRDALDREGLLRLCELNLDDKIRKHFPHF